MKTAVVIDTNVILVANDQHEGVSEECVIECVNRLNSLRKTGCVVIDDSFHILLEYQKKTNPKKPIGVGDAFVRWLLEYKSNPHFCEQVTLNELSENQYKEFPCSKLEAICDPPDRKFIAVANAHPDRPPVWQAADCKWLNWSASLSALNIKVEFLCFNDICQFYRHKFPGQTVPKLR
ncbi:MAG TPA: hypothetical protein PKO27_14610 [Deltaproteobacteria bacterium]|nr:hypothetical protein [Deltaproteobacteria bacterium]HPA08821.1 hypothetical protein [Methanoregulaceae archaeon]